MLFQRVLFLLFALRIASVTAALPNDKPGSVVRIAATQPKSRLIPRHATPEEALAKADQTIADFEAMVVRAASQRCDLIVFPEDTLGLGTWEAGNPKRLSEVLPAGVERMLERFGKAAASNKMYLICCNDTVDSQGVVRNSSFFLGRDGKEIGRYHKVNMPIHELYKQRGDHFPVFQTPDLGGVGMLICYDMVFPEAARCLTLGGAEIIVHPTLGGAAVGDGDISLAAFRTRAVENFVYVVVSQRGSGSMIISPQGKIVVQGKQPDEIVIAEINPFAGREGGDAMNHQVDMRARLFRERSPAAYGILVDPHPPVLKKAPETISISDASRIAAETLTVGETEFKEADALRRAGKRDEAVAAFKKLRSRYPQTWIDQVSKERLESLSGP